MATCLVPAVEVVLVDPQVAEPAQSAMTELVTEVTAAVAVAANVLVQAVLGVMVVPVVAVPVVAVPAGMPLAVVMAVTVVRVLLV